MSLAPAAKTLLKIQTPLQQLLMDINFQRTMVLRQLTEEESGFVVLQGTTYWTDLFVRHFLFQLETIHTVDSDDLLFFVRKKHLKNSSRHMPKYKTEVDVFRKDSRKLPIGDPDVDWEETVYLNMVLHQFDYTLTLAICTRTSPKELQVLHRHTQRVYASPSRRKMDTKGEGEEMIYPHICFMVDNFDEVFSEILVRDGEMVCVELVANDKNGAVQGVIFLGSIRYDALKKVYDGRQSSLSSKVAQRMSFGLFSGGVGVQTRCEFVQMKGPQGKGHAEIAVTKPKGCGVETPNSEPGFCATYKWDDWDEDSYNYYLCRQRRLSDPSSNLNNFAKYNWLPKNGTKIVGSTELKSRSVNEGLDTLANEVSEIEAGDIKDDQGPTFVTSEIKSTTSKKIKETINAAVESPANTSTGCSSCFRSNTCKPWPFTKKREIYCPTCEDVFEQTSAYLTNIPITRSKDHTFLGIDSELIVGQYGNLSNGKINKLSRNTFLANTIRNEKLSKRTEIQKQKVTTDTKSVAKNDTTPKISGKCSLNQKNTVLNYSSKGRHHDVKAQEYEIADDATTLTVELDDGAFNPLWASRGFTQNFYFWKENRRQQSTPLNAFLTYITLPWWSIAKDLLDHRETPILTF